MNIKASIESFSSLGKCLEGFKEIRAFRRLKGLIETLISEFTRLANQMRLKWLTNTNLHSNSDVFHVYEI